MRALDLRGERLPDRVLSLGVELLDRLHVSDAMTTPAICVQHKFLIGDCLGLMRMSGVRSVPVLDRLEPVGILSFGDVLRAAINGRR
jgi:CBS domain-containing protein